MLKLTLIKCLILSSFVSFLGQDPASPLRKCWDFESTEKLMIHASASDNANQIIISGNSSTIISLDKRGNLLWTKELGGELLSTPWLSTERGFVVVKKKKDDTKWVLLSFSLETGLTIWERRLALDEGLESGPALLIKDNVIHVIGNDGSLHIVDCHTGSSLLHRKTNHRIVSNVERSEDRIYFSVESNNVVEYSLSSMVSKVLYEGKNKITKIYRDGNRAILLADLMGFVSLFDLKSRRLLWSYRLGAGVSSILKMKDEFLVGSLDNNLYLLAAKNGKLVWKRRFEGRLQLASWDFGKQIVVSVLNKNRSYFLEIKNGRVVEEVILEDERVFVSEPVIIGDLTVLLTNRGIAAYSRGNC